MSSDDELTAQYFREARYLTHDPLPDETPAETLLREWLKLWAAEDYMPGKLPDALHIRTAMYLVSRRYGETPDPELWKNSPTVPPDLA